MLDHYHNRPTSLDLLVLEGTFKCLQIEPPVKEPVLWQDSTVNKVLKLGDMFRQLTQIVRGRNVSRVLTSSVEFPCQNQTGGDCVNTVATTPLAYSSGDIASGVLLMWLLNSSANGA